jgi:dCTP deaminase
MKKGVYPDKEIRQLIEQGVITSSKEIQPSQIQPASIDLTMGKILYHMPYSSIPKGNVDEFLNTRASYRVDLEKNGFLHKGNIYVAELNESLNLPPNIQAKANPKSSIGRIDVHVRLITEDGRYFDEVPAGYKGKLFLEIYPISFDIILSPNSSLNQIRFFDIETEKLSSGMLGYLSKYETLLTNKGEKLQEDSFINDDFVQLTLDLSEDTIGYVARHDAPPIDLSKRDLPLSKYFSKVNIVNNGIIIQKILFIF